MSLTEQMPAIHIDPAAANNRGDGTSALTAWRDCEELRRRLGKGSWRFRQPTTIHFHGSPPASDALLIDAVQEYGAHLTIVGDRNFVASGTVATATAFNRGAQTLDQITSAIGGGFGPHVGRYLRVSSGPRTGVTCVIGRSPSSNTAELSNPGTTASLGTRAVSGDTYAFTRSMPQAGDAFDIVTLPKIPCGQWTFTPGAPRQLATEFGNVAIQDLHLNFGATSAPATTDYTTGIKSEFATVSIMRCVVELAVLQSSYITFLQTSFSGRTYLAGSGINNFRAGYHTATHLVVGRSAVAQIYDNEWFENNVITVGQGGNAYIDSACGFRRASGGDALNVNSGGVVVMPAGNGSFWGTANEGRGIRIASGAHVYFSMADPPTCNAGLGSGREVKIGDVDMLYTDIPAIARGASIQKNSA